MANPDIVNELAQGGDIFAGRLKSYLKNKKGEQI